MEGNFSQHMEDIVANATNTDTEPEISKLQAAVNTDDKFNAHEVEEFKLKRQRRKLIGKYSDKAFDLVKLWIQFVMLIVIMDGLWFFDFSLSDSVLITLLSTTTINVIGLLTIVFTYIFYIKDK